jgi:hypothetical protein
MAWAASVPQVNHHLPSRFAQVSLTVTVATILDESSLRIFLVVV